MHVYRDQSLRLAQHGSCWRAVHCGGEDFKNSFPQTGANSRKLANMVASDSQTLGTRPAQPGYLLPSSGCPPACGNQPLSPDMIRPSCSRIIASSSDRKTRRDFSISNLPRRMPRKRSFRFRLAAISFSLDQKREGDAILHGDSAQTEPATPNALISDSAATS